MSFNFIHCTHQASYLFIALYTHLGIESHTEPVSCYATSPMSSISYNVFHSIRGYDISYMCIHIGRDIGEAPSGVPSYWDLAHPTSRHPTIINYILDAYHVSL